MNLPPPVLALDQSTSATKAVLVDAHGEVLATASRTHRQHYPQPGWVEHDAEEIWQNTRAVLHEILGQAASVPVRLSLTNQRETFLLFHEDGRPATPAVVWQCRRGIPVCEQLQAEATKIGMERRTGLRLDTYFSAPKLRRVLQDQPELARAWAEGKVRFGTIDTFLIYRLTGGRIYATDATNASRTLLYNLGEGAWDPVLGDLFQISTSRLPEIRACSDGYGVVQVDGLPPLEIRGVMGDSHASLLAQYCVTPGDVKATFGTGTSLLMNTGLSCRPPEQGIVSALAWRVDGKDTYALEAIVNYSAATLVWLIDRLGLCQDHFELEQLARQVEDSGEVVLVPAFAGLGAPHWSPSARGLLCGLSSHTSKEQVARAGYDSIALQIADALALLAKVSRVEPTRLRADGGPTQSEFLMELTANCCQCPLEVNPNPGLSPLGAILAGRLGCGETNLADLSVNPPVGLRRFSPAQETPSLQAMRDRWETAIHQALAGATKEEKKSPADHSSVPPIADCTTPDLPQRQA